MEYKSPLKEALCKFKQLNTKITKDSDNPFFKSKYADLATILDAVEEDMASFGLLISSRTELIGETLYTRTLVLHKDSDETMESIFPVFGNKPQEVGSSITYARRYNIQSLMNLAAEDDDGNAANKGKPAKTESAASRNKRYEALKSELAASDDPAVTWHQNKDAIAVFKEELGDDYYNQLIDVSKKRKEELAQLAMMEEQSGGVK